MKKETDNAQVVDTEIDAKVETKEEATTEEKIQEDIKVDEKVIEEDIPKEDTSQYDKNYVDSLLSEIEELKSKLPQEKSEREIELEKRERELMLKERDITLKLKLKENNINADVTKFIREDIEVDEFINVLKAITVETSYVPHKHTNSNEGVTLQEFKKMNYSQRLELMRTNQELYNKYINA